MLAFIHVSGLGDGRYVIDKQLITVLYTGAN